MPIGPSALPWWGWLLCAAVAGVFATVGMYVANDARLDERKWARQVGGMICAFVGLWTAVSMGGIGIASLPHFWMAAVFAGLLLLMFVGMVVIGDQLTRLEEKVTKLSEPRNAGMREHTKDFRD